jgi:hypothetical protein
MLPTILEMAIRTRMAPSDLLFMAKILEAFWAKVPKKKIQQGDYYIGIKVYFTL